MFLLYLSSAKLQATNTPDIQTKVTHWLFSLMFNLQRISFLKWHFQVKDFQCVKKKNPLKTSSPNRNAGFFFPLMYHHKDILSRQRGQNYPHKHTRITACQRKSFVSVFSFFVCMLFCLQWRPAAQSLTDQDHTNTQWFWSINSVLLSSFGTACISKKKKKNPQQQQQRKTRERSARLYIDCLLGLNFNIYSYSRKQDEGCTLDHSLSSAVIIDQCSLFYSGLIWVVCFSKLCIVLCKAFDAKGVPYVSIDYPPRLWCRYGTLKMRAMRV